jgi:hypothetical protein
MYGQKRFDQKMIATEKTLASRRLTPVGQISPTSLSTEIVDKWE